MEIVDPRKRFSETAADYDRHRPSYPAELIDWILAEAGANPGSTAVDIGCGTGIFSRLLAAQGLRVLGMDPNEVMLARARARGGGPEYRFGEASATGLPAACADLATAAQAFHWFPIEPTLRELSRILKPSGTCTAVWNLRTRDTPFLRGYEDLLNEFSAEYRALRADESVAEEIQASPLVANWRRAEFPSVQSLDRAAFLGRAHSSSYVAHGVARREKLDLALESLFESHARNGRVEFLYRSVGFCWNAKH